MKAYVAPIPTTLSRGIHRVADALAKYAPADVEIMSTRENAIVDPDLLVFHMIGQEGWQPYIDHCRKTKTRFAIVQYCFRTTSTPNAAAWLQLWDEAAVVMSYYDLPRLAAEDGVRHCAMNFVRTPLGVDTSVFQPDPDAAMYRYLVATSGYVAGTECVGEWGQVCDRARERQFHLGPVLAELAGNHTARVGVSDADLAKEYSRARYVSGLRRSEGFELPAFEGLACGARPVMFYREDALYWLGPHAEYVQEGSPEYVIAQLTALMRLPYRPVEDEEIAWVGREFSWQRTAERFWSAIPR